MRVLTVLVLALFPMQYTESAPFAPPVRCEPPTMWSATPGQPEAHPVASGADVWALLFSGQPIRTGQPVKIAWHMTGSGVFGVNAYSPAGVHVPSNGIEPHRGSNWNRPGDEWGTHFVFPSAGCWDLHVTRDGSFGDLWLSVQAD